MAGKGAEAFWWGSQLRIVRSSFSLFGHKIYVVDDY